MFQRITLSLVAVLSFALANAQCTSNAADIFSFAYLECFTIDAELFPPQGSILDANDAQAFVVVSDTNVALNATTVLIEDPFGFLDLSGNLTNCGIYSYALVVGNALPGGGIDFSDPCLSVSNWVPFMYDNFMQTVTAGPPPPGPGTLDCNVSYTNCGLPNAIDACPPDNALVGAIVTGSSGQICDFSAYHVMDTILGPVEDYTYNFIPDSSWIPGPLAPALAYVSGDSIIYDGDTIVFGDIQNASTTTDFLGSNYSTYYLEFEYRLTVDVDTMIVDTLFVPLNECPRTFLNGQTLVTGRSFADINIAQPSPIIIQAVNLPTDCGSCGYGYEYIGGGVPPVVQTYSNTTTPNGVEIFVDTIRDACGNVEVFTSEYAPIIYTETFSYQLVSNGCFSELIVNHSMTEECLLSGLAGWIFTYSAYYVEDVNGATVSNLQQLTDGSYTIYYGAPGCGYSQEFITVSNTPSCDDNDCTTLNDFDPQTCICLNTPIPPPSCDDNDCSTADSYNTTTCLCENTPIPPPSCDDNDCTTSDSYDAIQCVCVNTPIPPPTCDDNDCTTADSYDAATCTCINTPIPPPSCDDNDCSTADSYNTTTCLCENTPIPPPTCDDNDCTTADSYDAATCSCINTPNPPPSCDDNDCSTADSYNTTTCVCENTPIPPPSCDDNDCNTADSYDATTCTCVHTPIPPPDCDDNDCMTADSYDAVNCVCENLVIVPPLCNDSDCSTSDNYNPITCQCEYTPIPPPDCDDNDCTTADSYDALTCTCINTPIPPPDCNDNDCNTADSYNTTTCLCENTPIPPPDCDDNDCNTDDVYDALNCECVNTPLPPLDCDDDDCNTIDSYDSLLCICNNDPIIPPDCDDGLDYTADSYDPATCLCIHDTIITTVTVQMPEAFSPNGDGINDTYKMEIDQPSFLVDFSFKIYNRFGHLVYSGTSPLQSWDGTLLGQLQNPDMYEVFLIFSYMDNGELVTVKESKVLNLVK